MKAFEPPEWDLSKEYRDSVKRKISIRDHEQSKFDLSALKLTQQQDLAREATIKMLAERARCLKAVDDEPEHIKGSWKPLVAEAKANIRKRIEREVC